MRVALYEPVGSRGICHYTYHLAQSLAQADVDVTVLTGEKYELADLIALTDDDAILPPQWLTSIWEEFNSDPSISGIGGRVELYDRNDTATAIRTSKDRMTLSLSSFDPGYIPIIGCNMTFRRHVIETVGGFDEYLGPGSPVRAVAEDVDFLYRVLRRGFTIVYSPSVLLYHNHGRRTDTAIAVVQRGYAIGRGVFYLKHILAGDWLVLKMAIREACLLTKDLLGDITARRPIKEHADRISALTAGTLHALRHYGMGRSRLGASSTRT